MKTVILCGGMGTRLREETEFRPKPMVEIGGRPILWHIMKIYSFYGFNDFVICLGYKGEIIKDYFCNYEMQNNDITIELGKHNEVEIHSNHAENGWKVTLADTGKDTMTGARIKRVEKYIESDSFMLSYGDGLADVNIKKLVELHKSHGRTGTMTTVIPPSRFGRIIESNGRVVEFSEKPRVKDDLINGGYFVFNKEIFNYLTDDSNCILERAPLEDLAKDGELMVNKHDGFWECMDTYRDFELLNRLWESKRPPWKIWD